MQTHLITHPSKTKCSKFCQNKLIKGRSRSKFSNLTYDLIFQPESDTNEIENCWQIPIESSTDEDAIKIKKKNYISGVTTFNRDKNGNLHPHCKRFKAD